MSIENEDEGYLENIPDTGIVANLLGKINLTPAEAIAEIVANSFDEKIDGKKINIEIVIPKNRDSIIVIDDGKGMDKDKLRSALTIGKSEKVVGQKGMYGIGLKTASSVLGKNLYIETATVDSSYVLQTEWDFQQFGESKQWKIPYKTIKREESDYFKEGKKSGTVIKISSLRKKAFYDEPIKEFLSLAYRHHLLDGDQIIFYGPLKPLQFNLIPDTYRDIEIKISSDKVIRGWGGLLVEGNKQLNFINDRGFGVNIYRNKQLIAAYYKRFLPRNHMDFGRVIGELHIDFIEVNYHKKGINYQIEDWSKIEELVKSKIKKFASASKESYTSSEKGKKVGKIKPDNWREVSKENLDEESASDPKGKEVIRRAKKMYKALGDVDIDDKETDEDEEKSEDVDVKKDGKLLKFPGPGEIEILGKKLQFKFLYFKDKESAWKWHDRNIEKDKIIIYLNEEFNVISKIKQEKIKDNLESLKIICILAFAEEVIRYLVDQGYALEKSQKEVYEWIDNNYDNLEIRFDDWE